MSPDNFDQEGFEDFLNESRDLLDDLQPALLELENNPGDTDLVDPPFRILHSIKGMSSFFGLTPIKRLSHSLEDLLTEIKEDRLDVTEDVIDVLYEGSDFLDSFYDEVFDGNTDITLDDQHDKFLDRVERLRESAGGIEHYFGNLVQELEDLSSEFLDDEELHDDPRVERLSGLVSEAKNKIQQNGKEDDKGYGDGAIFPESAEVDGVEIGQYLSTIESVCRGAVEDEVNQLDEESHRTFKDAFESFRDVSEENQWSDVLEVLEQMQEEYDRFTESAGFGQLLADSFLKHLANLEEELDYESGDSAGKDVSSNGASADISRTFRVEEQKVDDFMEYVGELIVTGEMFKYLEQELQNRETDSEILEQLRNTNQAFRELSNDLQESLLSIRQLPINDLLKKFPVMVRKLAGEIDKDVEMTLQGEETLVDKIFVEKLESPLTHLVRNAVDHGIEPPDEREERGKDRKGSVEIIVENDDQWLKIKIRDDGRGLDVEEIKEKVLEKGLVDKHQLKDLDDSDILKFIFESGFSTSDEVTDVSGRGVGMNAVKTTVEELDGEIDIESEPGEGTTITMMLPRSQSVNVIQSLVIEVDEQKFALPLEDVIESISLGNAQLKSVEDKGEMIQIRDSLYPLFRLRKVFDLEGTNPDRAIAMLLKADSTVFSVLADQIREQQKVVVKEMGPVFDNVEFAEGAAIMGDGDVCLVLDVEGLAEESRRLGSGRDKIPVPE